MLFQLLVHHELLATVLHKNLQHQFFVFLSFEFQLFAQHFLQLVPHWVELLYVGFLLVEDLLDLFGEILKSLQVDVGNVVGDFVEHGFVVGDEGLKKIDEFVVDDLGAGWFGMVLIFGLVFLFKGIGEEWLFLESSLDVFEFGEVV